MAGQVFINTELHGQNPLGNQLIIGEFPQWSFSTDDYGSSQLIPKNHPRSVCGPKPYQPRLDRKSMGNVSPKKYDLARELDGQAKFNVAHILASPNSEYLLF